MGAKKIGKNCGKEFDPDNLSDECRYHSEEAVHAGTADSRNDYSEVYKYPRCGQVEIPEWTSYQPAPGFVHDVHIARD